MCKIYHIIISGLIFTRKLYSRANREERKLILFIGKKYLNILQMCSNIKIYYRRVVLNAKGLVYIMGKFQKLSDTEMDLMSIIWRLNKEVTSSELLEIVERDNGKTWSGQTISTFLSRMMEKGVLTSHKKGRTNYYRAAVTIEEYRQKEAEGIINDMYKGSVKKFLSALYYGKKINKKEIDELKDWFSNK